MEFNFSNVDVNFIEKQGYVWASNLHTVFGKTWKLRMFPNGDRIESRNKIIFEFEIEGDSSKSLFCGFIFTLLNLSGRSPKNVVLTFRDSYLLEPAPGKQQCCVVNGTGSLLSNNSEYISKDKRMVVQVTIVDQVTNRSVLFPPGLLEPYRGAIFCSFR